MTTLEKIQEDLKNEQYEFMGEDDYCDGVRFGLMLAHKIIDKYAEQECEDDPYQTDMDEMWKQAKQEPCEDAVIREAGRCRTCKYGEVYNDLWCKCHDPLTDGIMVKMTDKCVSEEVLELNRRYKKGVGAKMGGG